MIARMARDAAHAGERMTLSVKLDHFSSSKVEGNDDEILEGARSEQRPVVSANANRFGAQESEQPIEHIDRGLFANSDQASVSAISRCRGPSRWIYASVPPRSLNVCWILCGRASRRNR